MIGADLIRKATGLAEEDVDRVMAVWLEVALLNIVFFGSYQTIFGLIRAGKDGRLRIDEQNPAIEDILSNSYSKQDVIKMITDLVVKYDGS